MGTQKSLCAQEPHRALFSCHPFYESDLLIRMMAYYDLSIFHNLALQLEDRNKTHFSYQDLAQFMTHSKLLINIAAIHIKTA